MVMVGLGEVVVDDREGLFRAEQLGSSGLVGEGRFDQLIQHAGLAVLAQLNDVRGGQNALSVAPASG
jgi:hypothetical protein